MSDMSDERIDHPRHYGGADNPHEVIEDHRKAKWYQDELVRFEGRSPQA